ncbi:hypothetical protein U27_07067 [Candidatus Vecturithrix granuli]|uniref:Uncharacterized protein n=1 Tax=Vecturithrix granuli TaxID=1499967 RepID=A0A081C674_VECG1|nr:hypothetical protein U27_07067 [Candidatus Vecturithrix granuli]
MSFERVWRDRRRTGKHLCSLYARVWASPGLLSSLRSATWLSHQKCLYDDHVALLDAFHGEQFLGT